MQVMIEVLPVRLIKEKFCFPWKHLNLLQGNHFQIRTLIISVICAAPHAAHIELLLGDYNCLKKHSKIEQCYLTA